MVSGATVGGLAYAAYLAIEDGRWDPGNVVSVPLEEGKLAHIRVIEKPEGWVTLAPIEQDLAVPVPPGCFAASGAVATGWDRRIQFTSNCGKQLQRIQQLEGPRRYYIRNP